MTYGSCTVLGPASQVFGYDGLYRLTCARGRFGNTAPLAEIPTDGTPMAHGQCDVDAEFASSASGDDQYTLSMQYDPIHNITQKTQHHAVLKGGGAPHVQAGTTYDWGYTYGQNAGPHAPTGIGDRHLTPSAAGAAPAPLRKRRGASDPASCNRAITF